MTSFYYLITRFINIKSERVHKIYIFLLNPTIEVLITIILVVQLINIEF